MKRKVALGLLKEILASECLEKNVAILNPSQGRNTPSHGYQLHIKSCTRSVSFASIMSIVDKHNLAVEFKPSEDLLTIYKPLKEE